MNVLNGRKLRVAGQLEGIDAGCAGFGKYRGHLSQLLKGGVCANALVSVHHAAVFQRDGHNGCEPALFACLCGALLAGKRDSIRLGAANTMQRGNQVGAVTHHQHAALGGELRVGEHTRLVCEHGHPRHHFHAAGNGHFGLSGANLQRRQGHGINAGGAVAVHGESGHRARPPGVESGVLGDIAGLFARLGDTAENDIGHLARHEPGAILQGCIELLQQRLGRE